MAKQKSPLLPEPALASGGNGTNHSEAHLTSISGMYEDYFLDYASYVILERAVPAMEDGLKPVQRRILHAMFEKEDGRYNKVANIIGNTMQFHPHGDAAIGEALVNMGQKDLLIDTQGNWGDFRTGDGAAAARYIEARLTKFALEAAFNPQTTDWQLSYDGRKREPVFLPMKFPLVLAQGADGIAVGLSTKILPHNFIELCKASIDILRGKPIKIYPDFLTGGIIDVADYNGGERGGRVKCRAKIEKADKNLLLIKELPYSVTVPSLIESITKAAEKGKIKIKRIDDNTAAVVEIAIELAPGVSPDLAIDALFAFTDCEVSLSPNACVIVNDKPIFTTVENILRICTDNTRNLLRQELEIKKRELEEKWLFASLEKIFVENRIYHHIETCESWEEVMSVIYRELMKYVATPSDNKGNQEKRILLFRELNDDDIVRLTEIRIKRISKYNSFKADELIAKTIEELNETLHHLENLTEYAIAWFKNLIDKYGKGRERRTVISGGFETIEVTQVVANNAKLYVDRKEGFVGMGLKKDEFVCDCSDIDDVIVFRRDGKFMVTRIADKTFVGKDIIHVAVWKKNDERTTYNMIYLDGKTGVSRAKRFNVTAITRDKEYDLTTGETNSKALYFSANPNGEAELVSITLSPSCSARIKLFDYGFADLEIKGRSSQGNIVTKYPVKKVLLKEAGHSTIGAIQIWMDEVSGRLNSDERGRHLGSFDTGDQLLAIYHDGSYELFDFDITRRFEVGELADIAKLQPETTVSAVYYDGNKEWTMVKRFHIETSSTGQRFSFISEHKSSKLYFATLDENPVVECTFKDKSKKVSEKVNLAHFIDIKGWKALGNKLSDLRLMGVKQLSEESKAGEAATPSAEPDKGGLQAGDVIDFEIGKGEQGTLF
jgi:topoisomerase-4 subunit A